MGLGWVTHVPIQVLPLHYQCCMTAHIPNIYSAVGGGGGGEGKWKCGRMKEEGEGGGGARGGRGMVRRRDGMKIEESERLAAPGNQTQDNWLVQTVLCH